MTQKNLVAVTPGGNITEDMLAGEYCWYSIPDEMKSLERVRREWKAAGLDIDRLPKSRRPEHVFMEACRSIEHGPQKNGQTVETRVEKVNDTAEDVAYQVTRHVWDLKNRLIEHPKAMRVIFRKRDQLLKFEKLEGGSDLGYLEQRIRTYFEGHGTKIPGHKLRTILRHYIEEVGAENMGGNSGRIYFMPKENRQRDGSMIDGREFVGRVATFLHGLYGTTQFHRVPCVNDEGQRAYLEAKFTENCDRDLEEYRDEVLDLLATRDQRSRGFRQDRIDNLIEARERIAERREKFEAILGKQIATLDRNMKLADEALSKFLRETAKPEVVAA